MRLFHSFGRYRAVVLRITFLQILELLISSWRTWRTSTRMKSRRYWRKHWTLLNARILLIPLKVVQVRAHMYILRYVVTPLYRCINRCLYTVSTATKTWIHGSFTPSSHLTYERVAAGRKYPCRSLPRICLLWDFWELLLCSS